MLPGWHGPKVDWSRYHLQVLFVDHSDQLRAKLAAAFFEQVNCVSVDPPQQRPQAVCAHTHHTNSRSQSTSYPPVPLFVAILSMM